jgi:AraC-like DNA-binding protein
MLYRSTIPAPPLDAFVENLWSLSDAPCHTRERILPSGTFELVINLREDEFRIHDATEGGSCRRMPGAIVSGAYRRFFVIDTLAHASVIGVHFRPGGAARFLGVPAGALADDHVELGALWGRRAGELRERLCAAAPAERFRLLEQALMARLDGEPRRHPAVWGALDSLERAGATVRELAGRAGLSHRRFIQLFDEEVGMTPKRFGRVRRFQRALALAQRADSVDWARLAYTSGYCDQSHLIRDFSAFSGLSPVDLHRHRRDPVKQNHAVVDAP